MAAPTPEIRLHDAVGDAAPDRPSQPIILLKLDESLLPEVRSSSKDSAGLLFVSGSNPKIRLGKRTIDLTISPEAFRHELYSASAGSLHDFNFKGVVSHHAQVAMPERRQSLGSDAALAALQSSLASYQQEKQAKQANITTSVLPAPKNRFEAARKQKLDSRKRILGSSAANNAALSGSGTPTPAAAPTSAPSGASIDRTRAMRVPVLHLLAMGPRPYGDILETTHIPRDLLDGILEKIAKQVDGKWQLTDRAFKELDVWEFGYVSQAHRQSAVENAVKAYDRMRLGKEDKLWQMLLPRSERNKGIVLSKLLLSATGSMTRPLTPLPAPSPNPPPEKPEDQSMASGADTPHVGASPAPKSGHSRSESGTALAKRLFSKDPKKIRAAEEAKDRKRKDKGSAAVDSDGESARPAKKRQVTQSNNPKFKSAEFVQSSDDSGGEREAKGGATARVQGGTAGKEGRVENTDVLPATRERPTVTARPENSATQPAPRRPVAAAKPKTGEPSAVSSPATTAKTTKPNVGAKSTSGGVSAAISTSETKLGQQKSSSSKPTYLSPAKTGKSQGELDVSDGAESRLSRTAERAISKDSGLTSTKNSRTDKTTNGVSSSTSKDSKQMLREVQSGAMKPRQKPTNGLATPGTSGADNIHSQSSPASKRAPGGDLVPPARKSLPAKHNKTTSNSSSTQGPSSSPLDRTVGINGNARPGVDAGSGSDSQLSVINDISYAQGVTLAQKFHDYYPRYTKLYDEQAAREARGERVPKEERQELWKMHRRLEEIKREIQAASRREHLED